MTIWGVICYSLLIAMFFLIAYNIIDSKSFKRTNKLLQNSQEVEAKEYQAVADKESSGIYAIRNETEKVNNEIVRLQAEIRTEEIRQKEKRELPARNVRKQKATDIFADLLAESHNPSYGAGIAYKIRLAMNELSDFATDRINLTDADLERLQKILDGIRADWKKVEVEGFADRNRSREQEEEAEEYRRRSERQEREWEADRIIEAAEERQYEADKIQERLLDEQKKANEIAIKRARGEAVY